jgi:hypothetical protein
MKIRQHEIHHAKIVRWTNKTGLTLKGCKTPLRRSFKDTVVVPTATIRPPLPTSLIISTILAVVVQNAFCARNVSVKIGRNVPNRHAA